MGITEQTESIEIKEPEKLPEVNITSAEEEVCSCRYKNLTFCEKLGFNLRYFSHKLSLMLHRNLSNKMVQIVYVSAQDIPKDYILALQKQYPNKEVKVIIPLSGLVEEELCSSVNFTYYYRNREYEAKVVKYPADNSNIWVYGIYSETFSDMDNPSQIYNFKYLAPYVKCVRAFVKRLGVDIVHSDNIPLYMGAEFERKQRKNFKLIQSYHNYDMLPEVEPFWAAINLADKAVIEKITKDRIIRKYLARLFNLKKVSSTKTISKCLDYFYTNYEKFRNTVNLDNQIEQNIMLLSLNKRIVKMFPNSVIKRRREYNQQYYSSKMSDRIVLTAGTPSKDYPFGKKTVSLYSGYSNKFEDKIIYNFNVNNFRNIRTINKGYVQRELGKSKIESKFTDRNLFKDDEVEICGYLDTVRTSALIFVCFDENASEDDYKSVVIPVLKAFELSKDIQFILNVKNASNNTYIKSLVDFFESQRALDGRWVYIDGKINLAQFMAASNIYLCPDGNGVDDYELLFTALKYGCVPVIFKKDSKNDLLKDIFDDMNDGCCFKLPQDSSEETKDDEDLLIKAINFYFNNASSWNLIMKNAMSYDSGWNFERIAAFNALYDELM